MAKSDVRATLQVMQRTAASLARAQFERRQSVTNKTVKKNRARLIALGELGRRGVLAPNVVVRGTVTDKSPKCHQRSGNPAKVPQRRSLSATGGAMRHYFAFGMNGKMSPIAQSRAVLAE